MRRDREIEREFTILCMFLYKLFSVRDPITLRIVATQTQLSKLTAYELSARMNDIEIRQKKKNVYHIIRTNIAVVSARVRQL